MANLGFKNKFLSLSPYLEVITRFCYWKNIKTLSKLKLSKFKNTNKTPNKIESDICYEKIKDYLLKNGVKHDSLLLIHSAFSPFNGRGKTANQVLDYLLNDIVPNGTIAMPAMAKFGNSVSVEDYLSPYNGDIYIYDVKKTKIKTGLLPLLLHKKQGSFRSYHPINTMVAYGPLAEPMMQNNLLGSSPLPCGENSSWKYCLDNNAIIVGLGIDLTHSLTMIHVAEDIQHNKWPVKDWYIEKKYIVKDGNTEVPYTLRERDPRWGTLHFAERTLCKDLIDNGILKTEVIEGVTVEVIHSKQLIQFLDSRNSKGYPYFLV